MGAAYNQSSDLGQAVHHLIAEHGHVPSAEAQPTTVLLDRAGGSVQFTEAVYEAIVERHGGRAMMTIHVEKLQLGDGQEAVRATLVRKRPRQGELPA